MTLHARDRAAERYGVALDAADCRDVDRSIRWGGPHALPLGQRPSGADLYALRYGGHWLAGVVIGPPARRRIVTFLPASYLREHLPRIAEHEAAGPVQEVAR